VAAEIILIVDDNPGNLRLTEKVLATAGYQTQVACDAEQALRSLKSDAPRPDLILMDIQLPGVDGLTLTRLLKHNQSTSDITVVAITGYAMAGDEQRASASGCDDFISKPISARALLAIISYHLARRRQPLWARRQQLTPAHL
jgi:two-component system, cell cycle response regulator DivK